MYHPSLFKPLAFNDDETIKLYTQLKAINEQLKTPLLPIQAVMQAIHCNKIPSAIRAGLLEQKYTEILPKLAQQGDAIAAVRLAEWYDPHIDHQAIIGLGPTDHAMRQPNAKKAFELYKAAAEYSPSYFPSNSYLAQKQTIAIAVARARCNHPYLILSVVNEDNTLQPQPYLETKADTPRLK